MATVAGPILSLFVTLLALSDPAAAAGPDTYPREPARQGAGVDLLALIESPPLGLPGLPLPDGNPPTRAGVDLGRKLFFDRRLSFNRTLSCAMCHVPEQGFTQREVRTPVGIEGRFVKRNAPTLLNVAYRRSLFHDGRESTLENQVWAPLLQDNEMGNPSIGFVLQTLRDADDYRGLFEGAFDDGLTAANVGRALASYQRGLLAADSAFDRWYYGGEEGALGESARRGWKLFRRLGCISCHTAGDSDAQFSDGNYYDTGIGFARSMGPAKMPERIHLAPGVQVRPAVGFALPKANDLGRYEATGRSADRWLYRVPTLRNVALTAPFMHDGSFSDLAAVVAYYNRGGVEHPGLDRRIRPLGLNEGEQADLVAFLESLTGTGVDALVRDARNAPIGDTR